MNPVNKHILPILCAWLSLFAAGARAGNQVPSVMFLGDSITAGKGYCWRYHLWKRLKSEGWTVDFVGDSKDQPYLGEFDSDHEGYGGKTADQVAKLAAPSVSRHKPDIAFIDLGTNDYISQKEPAALTAQEIAGIVDQLRAANPHVTIFLTKIPFVKEDQGGEMDKLAATKNTADSPIRVVDLRTGWQFEPGLDTVDYVHPNLTGALKIADRFYDALAPELQRRGLKAVPPPQPRKEPELVNVALAKPATADVTMPGCRPKKAVDGDWKTMWAADEKPPHWLQVDLGAPQDLAGSGVVWDSAGAAYGYKIEASTDGTNWVVLADHSQEPKDVAIALEPQRDVFTAKGVEFVRLTVTYVPNASWTKYPAAVREFQLFGTPH